MDGMEGSSPTELDEAIADFLRQQFPQIKMHGGTAAILESDPEDGSVAIKLGGACSGCGLSPMTIEALKRRLTEEFSEVDTVHVTTGDSSGAASAPSDSPF